MASEGRSSVDEKFSGKDESLETLIRTEAGLLSPPPFDLNSPSSNSWFRHLEDSPIFQILLRYPAPGSLKLRSTSWLDGVRGIAALEVYIFHALGCWTKIVLPWHPPEQASILQLPLIRTLFTSGGAAVAVFFVLSGYVLTYKSLSWMRTHSTQNVGPAVLSSLFRRPFRLYLPPLFLTLIQALAVRIGYTPALNFTFVPCPNAWMQFLDWISEANHLMNPYYNFTPAILGFVRHPKYEPVIWTIPVEFYGSLVCYFLLALLTRVPTNNARMASTAVFAVVSMALGSWNIFCFAAGMLLADFNLGQDAVLNPSLTARRLWMALFAVAFYVAGLPTKIFSPEAPRPGYETLMALTPSLHMEDSARFMWSLSGISLLLSMSQLPSFKRVFESNLCQYLGRISFSLYLVHLSCMVIFGLKMQDWILWIFSCGRDETNLFYWVLCIVWFVLFSGIVFAVAAQVEKWVDAPSVRFARWLEGRCLKAYHNH
jgi:peptidoglycan/LPS O-acetylase OafA/YrhL